MLKKLLKLLLLLFLLAFIGSKLDDEHLAKFGEILVVSQTPEKSDAIVVLLGGEGPIRVLEAAKVFGEGFAPIIVFGSGYMNKDEFQGVPGGFVWPSSGERYKTAFLSLKIPEQALKIVDTTDGVDTDGELRRVADYARSVGWNKVILVTSAFHSRRVHLIWNRLAPDIASTTIAAPTSDLPLWWKEVRSVRAVGYEYGALVKEGVRRIIR